MFRDHFGIEENPFSNTPDPDYLFMSERHREALAHLEYGIHGNSGFVLLTGEVGTGKTTVCRCLIEKVPENIDLALCLNPRMSEAELLATICDEMGIDTAYCVPDSVKDHMDALNRSLLGGHAKGRRAVLVVDEAQNLSHALLEQVRMLTNLETPSAKLLQVILIGQPELRDRLAESDLRQLAQRITARYHLDPMTEEEARAYILHRVGVGGLADDVFDGAALREIYQHSGGVPRLINSICERCLLGAFAAGRHRVDGALAAVAAAEVLGHQPQPAPDPAPGHRRGAAGWAAAAVIAAAVALLLAMTGTLGIDATRTPAAYAPVPKRAGEPIQPETAAAPAAEETAPAWRDPLPADPPAAPPSPPSAGDKAALGAVDALIARGAVSGSPPATAR